MRRSRTRHLDTGTVQLDLFADFAERAGTDRAVAQPSAVTCDVAIEPPRDVAEPEIGPGDLAVFRSPHFDHSDPFPEHDPWGRSTPFFVTKWAAGYLYGVRADRVAADATLTDVLAAVAVGLLHERSLAYRPGPPEYRLLNRPQPPCTYFSPYHDLTLATADVGPHIRFSSVAVDPALGSAFAAAITRRPDLLVVTSRGTRWHTAHEQIRVDLALYARGEELAVLPIGVRERGRAGWGGAIGSCVSKAQWSSAFKAFVELAAKEPALW